MVFSQDGNQRASGKWTFYVYDHMNRLVQQGENTSKTVVASDVYIQNYYDDHDFVGTDGFTDSRFNDDESKHAMGSLTGTVMNVLGSNDKIYTAYYYDIKGRVTRKVQSNLLGGYDVTTTTYTFTNHPAAVTHEHTANGKTTRTEVYTYTYDYADRLSSVKHKLGGTEVTLASYTYDSLGRQSTKKLHGSSTNQLTYTYNIRNWLSGISGSKFNQNLYYTDGNGTACYNGNISSMTWKSGDETTLRGYKYTYDGLDRLKTGIYGEGSTLSTNVGRFTESVGSYDKNGNIMAGFVRSGLTSTGSYANLNALTITLNGNQIQSVTDHVPTVAATGGFEFVDGASETIEYTYDNNGNLTKDSNKGISNIAYNVLNLPSKVTFSDGSTITYSYAADGTKLRTVHSISGTTTTKDYCANVVYENGVQKMLLTEEGYVDLSASTPTYYYYLKDHQGNNRVVINSSGVVQETNHYYPFGGVFASTGNVQPYKYNGKELDTKKSLNWYDYGARHYDAALGCFTSVDPSSENYFETGLYAYCGSNPINRIDPNGADWYQDNNGNLHWQKGSETLEGYTNIGATASIQLGENSYLNFYQNGGIWANQAVNAFDLINASPKLRSQFLGTGSILSEDDQITLLRSLVNKQSAGLVQPIALEALSWSIGGLGGKVIGKVVNWGLSRILGNATTNGYKSFAAFKKVYGTAGEGQAWHHIVEQNPSNIAKFGAERIHNINNMVKLPHGKGSIHAKVTGYYNSKPEFTNGLTVRNWLKTKNYEEQFEFGIKVLESFGW